MITRHWFMVCLFKLFFKHQLQNKNCNKSNIEAMSTTLKIIILSLFHFQLAFLSFVYHDIDTLNISYPGNIHVCANVTTSGQIVKATLTWSNSDYNLTLTLARNGVKVTNSTGNSPLSLSYTTTSTTTGFFTYKVSKSGVKPVPYKIDLYLAGVLLRTDNYLGVSNNTVKTIYRYNVTSACPRVEFSSPQRTYFSNFYALSPSFIPTATNIQTNYSYVVQADQETFVLNLTETGVWYFIPVDAISAIPSTTYSVENNISIGLRCILCGNHIQEQGESCDNGNSTGCINCIVGPEYVCTGNVSAASVCTCKSPTYVLNQTSSLCTLDCSLISNTVGNTAGQTNSCQCMLPLVFNVSSLTCIVDCNLIEYGVTIEGDTTKCFCIKGYEWSDYRCSPICGDGIVTVEQQCDDGNSQDGDGCDSNCRKSVIRKDYSAYIIGFSVAGGIILIIVVGICIYVNKKKLQQSITIRRNKIQNQESMERNSNN